MIFCCRSLRLGILFSAAEQGNDASRLRQKVPEQVPTVPEEFVSARRVVKVLRGGASLGRQAGCWLEAGALALDGIPDLSSPGCVYVQAPDAASTSGRS